MSSPGARPRVVHLIYNLGLGGAERQLFELTSRLPQHGYDVHVLRFQAKGEYAARLEALGIPVHTVEKRSGIDVVFLYRMWSLLRRLRPAILHCWMYSGNLWGSLLVPFLRPRPIFIAAVRNTYDKLSARLRRDYLYQARQCEVMLGNSGEVREFLLRNGVPPEKTLVIENGISFERFDSAQAGLDRDSVLKAEGLDPALPLVLAVGRLVVQKDHKTFIEAARQVLERGVHAQFAILGDGPREEETRAWIAAAGLEGKLRILPARERPEPLVLSCAVFCLPSLHEGFPNALAEALACGRPCIATAVSGSSEMIRDGESGSLIQVGDSAALAERIAAYLADPALAVRHGAAAKSFIRETYGVERMVERYSALYQRLLASRR